MSTETIIVVVWSFLAGWIAGSPEAQHKMDVEWDEKEAQLLFLAALPEGSTECRPVAEAGGSWVVEDSKGCGFNHGVVPTYVIDQWVACEQAGGYDYASAYCSLWGIVPSDETD